MKWYEMPESWPSVGSLIIAQLLEFDDPKKEFIRLTVKEDTDLSAVARWAYIKKKENA